MSEEIKGIKRLRAMEWPWVTETADLMEEMALILEIADDLAKRYGTSFAQAEIKEVLKRYEEWK